MAPLASPYMAVGASMGAPMVPPPFLPMPYDPASLEAAGRGLYSSAPLLPPPFVTPPGTCCRGGGCVLQKDCKHNKLAVFLHSKFLYLRDGLLCAGLLLEEGTRVLLDGVLSEVLTGLPRVS